MPHAPGSALRGFGLRLSSVQGESLKAALAQQPHGLHDPSQSLAHLVRRLSWIAYKLACPEIHPPTSSHPSD